MLNLRLHANYYEDNCVKRPLQTTSQESLPPQINIFLAPYSYRIQVRCKQYLLWRPWVSDEMK